MKRKLGWLILLFLLACSGCITTNGNANAEFKGFMAGLAATIATDDAELGAQVWQQVAAEARLEEEQKSMLSKLPPGWQCPGGDLYWSDEVDCMVYSRPDKDWVKFNGVIWIDPNTNLPAQPLIAPLVVSAPEKAAAAVPQKASEPPMPMKAKPINRRDAQKIMGAQKLEGDLFQDRKKKTWYIHDQEGNYHILKGGAFKKI